MSKLKRGPRPIHFVVELTVYFNANKVPTSYEADAVAATNPPAAGDAALTGIEHSPVAANDHDDSESESTDSTESSTDSAEFAPAADDAAESRARTDTALAASNGYGCLHVTVTVVYVC